jgi:Skp family chaperone for outer membrane proteins
VDAADKLRNRLRLLGVEVSKIDFASALSGAGLEGAGKGAADAETALVALSKTAEKEKAKLEDIRRGRQGPIAELEKQSNALSFALFGGGKAGTRARAQQKIAESEQLAQVNAANDAIKAFEKRQQSALAAVKQAGSG